MRLFVLNFDWILSSLLVRHINVKSLLMRILDELRNHDFHCRVYALRLAQVSRTRFVKCCVCQNSFDTRCQKEV